VARVAALQSRAGAFAEAQRIIAASPGYIAHELQRCVEKPNRYLLLVRWRALEDPTEGFRKSAAYQEWKRLLHHFYDPFPTVEHYERVAPCRREAEGARFTSSDPEAV
jgi:heme-degrading monooxygenase HmoA